MRRASRVRSWPGRAVGPLASCVFLLTLMGAFSQAESDSAGGVLSQGRVIRLKQSSNPARNLVLAKFVKDPAPNPLQNPLGCPDEEPWVRLKAAGGYDSGRQNLPCSGWKGSLSNLTYKDRAGLVGGVRLVRYRIGSIQVQWKGSLFSPVALPLPDAPWVEVSFGWGGPDFLCGRFENFRKNNSAIAVGGPGSAACVPDPTPTPTPTSPPPSPSPSPAGQICPPESDCLEFGVLPGSGELLPLDDGESTWLRVFDFTGAGVFANATGGDWGESALPIARGPLDESGREILRLIRPAFLRAGLPDRNGMPRGSTGVRPAGLVELFPDTPGRSLSVRGFTGGSRRAAAAPDGRDRRRGGSLGR